MCKEISIWKDGNLNRVFRDSREMKMILRNLPLFDLHAHQFIKGKPALKINPTW